jgi:hypothetical protein
MRYWELQELLCFATGMNSEEADDFCNNNGDYDDLCFDKFDVDFEQFSEIAEALLKLTPIIELGISKKHVNCFVDHEHSRTIIRNEVETVKGDA